ncbi:Uncharacterized protein SCF082_LOCUS47774, partial [Durusdinium trenchii]
MAASQMRLTDILLPGQDGEDGEGEGIHGGHRHIPKVPGLDGIVGRFDLSSFSTVDTLDLTTINMEPTAHVCRQDFRSFRNGFQDGTYGYLVPYQDSTSSPSGIVVRFDLATFSIVESLDLTNSGANFEYKQFMDGFTNYKYGFLVPEQSYKKFVRFSLSSFDTASVTAADLSSVSGSFVKGLVRVRYGYLVVSDGTVVKIHLESMSHETLTPASGQTLWSGLVDSSGNMWSLATTN